MFKNRILIFMVLIVLSLEVGQAYAQAIGAMKIDVSVENKTLKEAFAIIQQKSGIPFIYNDQLVSAYKNVTFKQTNADLNNVLGQILEKTNLRYIVQNNKITIVQKEVPAVKKSPVIRVLNGKVSSNGEPLNGVNVYIAGTTIGTSTNKDGEFSLIHLPDGEFVATVSSVGYKTYTRTITNTEIYLSVNLSSYAKELKAIEIRDVVKDGWKRWGTLFTNNFIGTSELASSCQIQNKESIQFVYSEKKATLEAFADEPIIILNKALGYRIEVVLESFSYEFTKNSVFYKIYPLFKQIEGSAQDRARWKRKRQEVYYGSHLHFMRSLFSKNFDKQGYEVHVLETDLKREQRRISNIYRPRYDMFIDSLSKKGVPEKEIEKKFSESFNKDSLDYYRSVLRQNIKNDTIIHSASVKYNDIVSVKDSNTVVLNFRDNLQIKYLRQKEAIEYAMLRDGAYGLKKFIYGTTPNHQTSIISLYKNIPIEIHKNGYYNNTNLAFDGYWSWFEKIATKLPYDYYPDSKAEPADNKTPSPANIIVQEAELPAADLMVETAFTDTLPKIPQEKVHLHFDKPYYSIGDTIWFKTYVVDARSNMPTNLSRVVYVDLIDESDSVRQSLRLSLNNGTANGDFILGSLLNEGNYRIRSYTNYMRNFDAAGFFDKPIRIGNSLSSNLVASANFTYAKNRKKENADAVINYKTLSGDAFSDKEVNYEIQFGDKIVERGKGVTDVNGNLTVHFTRPAEISKGSFNTIVKVDKDKSVTKNIQIQSSSTDVDVQFFPEGGDPVNSISSIIAFKAVGADGLWKDITGVITDEDNNILTEFKSEHAGMGNFKITPQPGKIYTSTVKFADGSEKKYRLPEAKKDGYVLSVNQQNDSIIVLITASQNLLGQGELMLTSQNNGVINYMAKESLTATSFRAVLPKSRFPEGILIWTLVANEQPVAERLMYVYHENNRVHLQTQPAKTKYKTREKVEISIAATDIEGKPLQGNFSVSVTDTGKVPFQEEDEITILSNLLLSSALKGYIENPNYYFTNTNLEKQQQLDNLLLTQGWRKFAVPEEFAFQPEQGTSEVSGKLTTVNGKKPIVNGNVLFLNGKQMISTTTDQNGKFKFDGLNFDNNSKFTVQATDAKGKKEVVIELDELSPPQVITQSVAASTVKDQAFYTYLENSNKHFEELKNLDQLKGGIGLKEVVVTGYKKTIQEIATQNSANLNGPGNASQVLTFVDFMYCQQTLSECLKVRASGVTIDLYGYIRSIRTGGIMLLVIDGVPFSDIPSGECGGTPRNIDMQIAACRSELAKMPSAGIESVEILQPDRSGIYGFRGANGVIVITTKTGKIDYSAYDYKNKNGTPRPLVTADAPGFFTARSFYSPVYNDPDNTPVRDLRSTIYWNPTIETDKEGKATISFFNSDGPGTYRLVTEGFGAGGELGRQVSTYSVE